MIYRQNPRLLLFILCALIATIGFSQQQEIYDLPCQDQGDAVVGKDRKEFDPNPAIASESYQYNIDIPASHPDGIDCLTLKKIDINVSVNSQTNTIPGGCFKGFFSHILACDAYGVFSCPSSTVLVDGNFSTSVVSNMFVDDEDDISSVLGTTIGFDIVAVVDAYNTACDLCSITNGFYNGDYEVCVSLIYEYLEPEDILDPDGPIVFCIDPQDPYEYEAQNDYELYEWFDTNGDPVFSSNRKEFTVPSAGVFTLVVTDDGGCTQTEDIEFQALQAPQISFSSANPLISCGSSMDTIKTSVEGIVNNTNYNYEWSGPNNFSASTAQLIPVDPGNYVLTVEDKDFDCEFTTTYSVQTIENSPAQIDSLSMDQLFLCSGDAVTLTAFVPYLDTKVYTYEWITGIDTTRAATRTVSTAGKYYLNMQDNLGCPQTTDSIDIIVANPEFAGDDNSVSACPSSSYDLTAHLVNNTATVGTWIEFATATIILNPTSIDAENFTGTKEYYYITANPVPCPNDTATITIDFIVPLACDDGDCSNGEEVWDNLMCRCTTINIPDPSTCVDDGVCANGLETWNNNSCQCEQLNIPDPSTCIDDGDCTNGEEIWDGAICECIATNIPDPLTCTDDGDCSNGEETWNSNTCLCEQLNIPDPSTCVDDGDCLNGIETWNTTTCNCDVSVETPGCTDSTAQNFLPGATCDDGSCILTCPDPGNCNDGSCSNGEEIWDGAICECIATNIPDPLTCTDDGDCSNGEETWNSNTCLCEQLNIPDPSTCVDDGDCLNGIETWNTTTCNCDVSVETPGCTDSTAQNFLPGATCDDGSCIFDCPDPGNCDDGDCSNGEEVWDQSNCECIATNIPDPLTCTDDGDCSNGEETWNAQTCTCEQVSIPDPTSCIDDGDCVNGAETWNDMLCSCEQIFEELGCTYPGANNYNPNATCDDGSCAFDCPTLLLNVGDTCDDGDSNTTNDIITASCDCIGDSPDCNSLVPTVQVCDDGQDCTTNDLESVLPDGTICEPCQGELVDCSTGNTTTRSCDDGDETTTNDTEVILDCDESICVPCAGEKKTTRIYLPNVMSRDQNGNNEFKILSSEEIFIIDFTIFDRWGNVVHHISGVLSSDPRLTWRGTVNNKPVQQGVYLYRIEYETGDGPEFGEITVLN